MFFRKNNAKYAAISSTAAQKNHPLILEVVKVLQFSAALGLLLSLVSYVPTDPSWSTWTTKPHFGNWMGRLGSILADAAYQLLGLTAWVLPLLIVWLTRKDESPAGDRRLVIGCRVAFLVALSALLQSLFRPAWMPWGLQNPGGLVGKIATSVFAATVGVVGSRLLSASLLIACGMVIFRYPLLSRLKQWSQRVVTWAKAWFPAKYEQIVSMIKAKWQNKQASHALVPFGLDVSLRGPAESPKAPSESSMPQALSGEEAPANEAGNDDSTEALPPISSWVPSLIKPKKPKVIAAPTLPKSDKDFKLPDLNLLSGKAESKTKSVDKNWYVEKANILVQKLKDFGVDGEVVHISPGPVITVYEFKPASGVKIKEIANLSDDLTLALSVLSVRIVAPIPGKPVVGIEIPSPNRETVFFKDLIQETPFFSGDLKIPIVLGRLASGEPVASDLASMPHLLIAGTTGTGKSVFINTLISSLLYRFTPAQLKLIMVDPKMVELSHYEGIPHLLLPVVVDSRKAVLALRWTVEEMERRYTLMHHMGVRHLDIYNERIVQMQKDGTATEDQTFLPYIVVIIDEYADLMAVVPKDVELSIARLAQKARASGIHLVLATQRPSTDVVTGTIKANFPSRISFRVASSIDSKTILDRTGADRLLGHGDLLFHSAGFMSLRRMQGPFLSDHDLNRIVEYLKSQGEPQYDERILAAQEAAELGEGDSGGGGGGGDEESRLYDQAVRLVSEKGEASISLIQRHLRIGYNRAASLMEQMEREGVVGQAAGPAKRRSVNVNAL